MAVFTPRTVLVLLVALALTAAATGETTFFSAFPGTPEEDVQLDAIQHSAFMSPTHRRSLFVARPFVNGAAAPQKPKAPKFKSSSVTPKRALMTARPYVSVASGPTKPKAPKFNVPKRALLVARPFVNGAAAPQKPKAPKFKSSSVTPKKA